MIESTQRAAGVNRLSLGVQSFDDAMLKRLGRVHDAAQARAAAAVTGTAAAARGLEPTQKLPTVAPACRVAWMPRIIGVRCGTNTRPTSRPAACARLAPRCAWSAWWCRSREGGDPRDRQRAADTAAL